MQTDSFKFCPAIQICEAMAETPASSISAMPMSDQGLVQPVRSINLRKSEYDAPIRQ